MFNYGRSSVAFRSPQPAITNRLGITGGYSVPQLGLGTYRMAPAETAAAVSYAIECGYLHVDCAKAYGNQKEVGQGLAQSLKTRRIKRENLFVTSKLWPTDQHPEHVEGACRETLRELQLDYLDLYLIHWPICWRHSSTFSSDADKYPRDANGRAAVDKTVTLLDTWRAMSALVDKGLVRSIGLSNCGKKEILEILSEPSLREPVLNQIELHPALLNSELSTFQVAKGILTAAYCPLGMPTRYTPPDYVALCNTDVMKRMSEFVGYSEQRILLNWSVDQGNVVIVKASKKEHIKANAKVARMTLDDPVRFVLNGYETSVGRQRVMNPTDFRDDGKPFFSEK